jgi:YHS domain-containing protein
MKTIKCLALALTLMTLPVLASAADDAAPKATEKKAVELKNQTHCPVMGGKIDSTVFTDIQGQRVYYCCPMCSESLKKDPDKYFKKAAAEGVLFENIQTVCPVSGEALDKSVFADYEGRRVYFCCEMCVEPFHKDPQKYLQKLDAPDEKKEEHSGQMNHEGHGHH